MRVFQTIPNFNHWQTAQASMTAFQHPRDAWQSGAYLPQCKPLMIVILERYFHRFGMDIGRFGM
jgi:hypothetical protein